MIPKFLIVTAGAAGLLASVAAFARPHFDGDSTIDIASIEQEVIKQQAGVDSNGDGSVSEAEFVSAKGGPMGRPGHHHGGFHGHEGPPPGAMGRHTGGPAGGPEFDFDAMEEKVFDQLDTDKNASLSREEFSRENLQAAHRTVFRTHLFKQLDANRDGALNREEMPDPVEHLRKMDTNGDGKVTREERRAARGTSPKADTPAAGNTGPGAPPAA